MHPQDDPCLSSFKFTLFRIHAQDVHHTQDESNESTFSQRGELGHGRDMSKQPDLNLSSLCAIYAYDHIRICISGWLPKNIITFRKRGACGPQSNQAQPNKVLLIPKTYTKQKIPLINTSANDTTKIDIKSPLINSHVSLRKKDDDEDEEEEEGKITLQCLTGTTGVHLHNCKTANFNPKSQNKKLQTPKVKIPSRVTKINSTLNILRQMMDNT